jgi:hypothetical protein
MLKFVSVALPDGSKSAPVQYAKDTPGWVLPVGSK